MQSLPFSSPQMQCAAVSTNFLPIKDPPQYDLFSFPITALKFKLTIQGLECGLTSQASGPPILALRFMFKQFSPGPVESEN